MKYLLLILVLGLSACGQAPAFDNAKCSAAFSGYEAKIATLTVGTSQISDVTTLLGTPSDRNIATASDGSVWYTYGVAQDGTLQQNGDLCGNVSLQFNNSVLQKTTEEQLYK